MFSNIVSDNFFPFKKPLNKFIISDLPKMRKGEAKILVKILINDDSLLVVTAYDKQNENKKNRKQEHHFGSGLPFATTDKRKKVCYFVHHGFKVTLYLGNGLGHTQLLLLRGQDKTTSLRTYGLYFCSKLILKWLAGNL